MKEDIRVVITGIGGICALGKNSSEIWTSILNYNLGYKKYTHPDTNVKAKFFGRIDEDIDLTGFSKKITKNLPRFAKLGMVSAKEALNMAFGSDDKEIIDKFYTPFERGVIFGTGWGGQDATIDNNDSYVSTGYASPVSNILSMHSVCSGYISINWNFRGYQNTPIAACATSNVSIGDAYQIIKSGRAKMMLAGGAESIIGNYNVWTVDILGALSKEKECTEKACCPFDTERTGFILSEGAAAVCIERMDTAINRGANILAEITGYANFSDAYDITAPALDLQGRSMSIKKSLEEAKISTKDIDYINVHGTSTPLNDLNETQTLKSVFEEKVYDIPMSSTKSYTGHLIAAAGAMETILCIKSIETNIAPATVNLKNKDPLCDLDFIPLKHRRIENITNVLNINYGFGGVNSSLVLKRYQ